MACPIPKKRSAAISVIFFEKSCRKIWRFQKKVVTLHSQTGNKAREQHQQNDSVAQLVEQMTLNHWVVGSSPTGVT